MLWRKLNRPVPGQLQLGYGQLMELYDAVEECMNRFFDPNFFVTHNNAISFRADSVVEAFPGVAYAPNMVATTGLTDDTKPWVKFNKETWGIGEEAAGPAVPAASNEAWRKKSDFPGVAMYFDK